MKSSGQNEPSPLPTSASPSPTPRLRTPWLGSVTSTAHRYLTHRFFPTSSFSSSKPDTFCSCREGRKSSFEIKEEGGVVTERPQRGTELFCTAWQRVGRRGGDAGCFDPIVEMFHSLSHLRNSAHNHKLWHGFIHCMKPAALTCTSRSPASALAHSNLLSSSFQNNPKPQFLWLSLLFADWRTILFTPPTAFFMG